MKKLLRNILLTILILVLVVVVVGAVTINNWTRGPLPQHDGELTVAGLNDTVEVFRDEWGVPHIYASNTHDLFFAQGYTQAQDRWWQMEFSRHIGSGRIGELTGKNDSVFASDLAIRKMGWRAASEADLEMADPEMVSHLQSFADGVNAYILDRPASALALEYNILSLPMVGVSFEIEPWTPLDTLVWTKAMSWNLSGNEDVERFLSRLLDSYDQEMIDDFAPPFPYGQKPNILFPEDLPITEESLNVSQLEQDTAGIRGLDSVFHDYTLLDDLLLRGSDIGSNNWVAHGNITDTGMPLLANDPHLGIQMPSIWYEVGLHCQPVSDECPFDVVGFTFPSAPAVIIGHNANIAWGVTNVGPDTQDLYVMKINPDNPLQYEWNGEWRDMTVREETIRFGDGEDPLTIEVRVTHLGPITNDYPIDDDGNMGDYNEDDPMAMRWIALETGTIFESIIQLNQASNWEEFRDALRLWDTPSQNFVYADIEGNIGYQTPGLIPVRAPGHSGLLPVDGSTDEFEWLGFIPFDNLPRIWNPERGFVATANQPIVPLEYFDQLGETLVGDFGEDANYQFEYYRAYGYRGQRIVEMLEADESHSIESFQQIQGDNKMIVAEELAPFLAALDFEDDTLNDVRDWMLDWDYQMHMDSPQGALFGSFWARLMDNLYEDQLGDLGNASGGTQNMWATTLLADDPENVWWDDVNTENVETRDDILIRSFRETHDSTVEALGENRDEWAWGSLHTATFVSNPLGLSGISVIEDMVNRGPVPASGGSAIVNATGWSTSSGNFEVASLPSLRMIVDVSDFTQSKVMHTTGQSGHPFSDQYGSMIDSWRNIEYHDMLWTREQVEAAAANTLTLKPE